MTSERDSLDAALLEESAEELYEHAPAGYLSTLPGGLIVKVNETLLAWTGHTRDDLVGRKRLHDLLAPGARIYYETHYAPLLAMQGAVREIAVELVRADRTRLPVLLNSTLVRDASDEPRVVRTTVFDASERRRYERELQRLRADAESRARSALALDHVRDGVLLVTDGRVEVLNPAAERILDVAAADALGRPVTEVVAGWEELAPHVPVGAAAAARLRPAVLPLARDGGNQWLEAAGVDAGEGGVVYTLRDVTTERALEQLRGDVVAVVSHELRTPLTGVYGSAQTLLGHWDDLDDAVRRQLLDLVVEQAERLSAIVDRMLLTSRLDAGDLEPGGEPRAADALVRTAIDALPAAERGRVGVEPADAQVRGEDAVVQLLTHVLDNAVKYSAGPVLVRISEEGDVVRIAVSDEGPGIPPGERERVFDRFYRLDPDQRGGVGGAGLGLYIARELARRLGGGVRVASGGPGATLVAELPAARAAPESAQWPTARSGT